MSVKSIALMLCTCTWIEIMTGVGVTLYLAYLGEYRLAALSACLFSPLIGFHYAIDRSSGKRNVTWKKSGKRVSGRLQGLTSFRARPLSEN